MIKIDYPQQPFRTKKEGNTDFIFDEWRKRWVIVTPEEWVRQNFLQFLVQVADCPSSLIAVEKEILVGELRKRFDILVYDRNHQPWMMIECKAMDIPLDDSVFNRVLRYSIRIPAPYLVITNGHYCAAWKKEGGQLELLEKLPAFIL